MVDVDKLSDAELRTKLLEFGFPVMPITGTTRKVMAKKLKLLLENKNKPNNDGRRSLGRYSSEEESDTEVKSPRSQKNRRVTMAAPPMQPPASVGRPRKSAARTIEAAEDEDEVVSPRRETRNTSTTVTTTTRTHKIIKNAQDEYDTGSESESDIIVNNYKNNANDLDKRASPVKSYSSYTSPASSGKYSPPKSLDASYKSGSSYTSPSRVSSYTGGSLAADYAADRLNQIRQRYSLGSPSYDKPLYSSTLTSESVEKEETPFLSNFTRRLTTLTGKRSDNDYKNDIIKENDSNGASTYPRSTLASYRSARGREPANYDFKAQSSILKNNMISFAVLAVAALFFIFLALMYLGIKSDTNLVTQGYTVPYCVQMDTHSKPGVNCVSERDVTNAIHLLNVLRPELNKRAVANTCFDQKIKAHMTEAEVITFCKSNFGIQDEQQIRHDLKNLQILTFANPDWGLRVVQTENNNGIVTLEDTAKSMEQVVFNHANKITSFVIFEPSLPWRCSLYNTFSFLTKSVLFIGLIFIAIYAANIAYNWYKFYDKEQKDEIGFMVERIIDILQSNAGSGDENGENFVVINHVRDMILSVADRKKKASTWAKAVKFINENESRVRTEVQVVQGEPFEVWRWIGSANLSMSGDYSEQNLLQGRRIVDIHYILNEVFKFRHRRFYFCSNNDLVVSKEMSNGFKCTLLLSCVRCHNCIEVESEDPKSNLWDVNLAMVAGILSVGLGYYELREICSSLHFPMIEYETFKELKANIVEYYNRTTSNIQFPDKGDPLVDEIKEYSKKTENLKAEDVSDDSEEDVQNQTCESSFNFSEISTFEKAKDSDVTPSVDSGLDDSGESIMLDDDYKKKNFLLDLEKTAEERDLICKMTKDQRGCTLWFDERKIRLTASRFGQIYKLSDKTDRRNTVRSLLESNFKGNIYTQHGIDHESVAIAAFEKLTNKTIEKCGLFIDLDNPFLAATPDGLVKDENAIIEVKCPYTARNFTPKEAINQKLIKYGIFDEYNQFRLKRGDNYYYQVQGQLFISGRDTCYFIVWTNKGLVYEIIHKDYDCWKKLLPKLKSFYFDYMLPEILEKI